MCTLIDYAAAWLYLHADILLMQLPCVPAGRGAMQDVSEHLLWHARA